MPLRRLCLVLLTVATLTACKSDSSSGPPAKPDRALLDGDYNCEQFQAYTVGPQGAGWYEGSCLAYLTFASPTLADSGRTYPFTVSEDNTVFRLDYPQGTIAYDTAAVVAVISYPGLPQDQYTVSVDNTFTYFLQKLVFDFSGDAQMDTLYLTFANRR
ncbi:MAG TPA: hypothetical protein VK922_03850 [Gemmatimonadaceae bacterium]|nr:hypothetical protein [Gemmatimonadaceae bacterium]